jgi:hypothetical protein
MSVTALEQFVEDAEAGTQIDRNLPWNNNDGGLWDDRRYNLNIVAGSNDLDTYFEVRSWALRFLEVKPIKEEGFYWDVVHRSKNSIVWHRYPL